ncbi:MAG: hypothetical protein FWH51_03030, partial [Dehalococcoidia bacterium]|nr:hypothetical protein [Dehalococcoidia bacterium]
PPEGPRFGGGIFIIWYNYSERFEMALSEVCDLPELCRRYPKRWVAARVLEREDNGGQPIKVEVILAHTDIYSVRTGLDKGEYCVIYTGPVPEEKYVLMY